jgi:hypothetical protein
LLLLLLFAAVACAHTLFRFSRPTAVSINQHVTWWWCNFV